MSFYFIVYHYIFTLFFSIYFLAGKSTPGKVPHTPNDEQDLFGPTPATDGGVRYGVSTDKGERLSTGASGKFLFFYYLFLKTKIKSCQCYSFANIHMYLLFCPNFYFYNFIILTFLFILFYLFFRPYDYKRHASK